MKTQATFLLAAVALASLAKADWQKPSADLSWDTLCGAGEGADTSTSHVCFISSHDVSGIIANTNFHGFYNPDDRNFVMYQSGGETTAFYGTENFSINVNFDVKVGDNPNCAAYDVQTPNGTPVINGIYCPGQAAIKLD